MRRKLLWCGRLAFALVAALGGLLLFLNTAPGFRLIERCTPWLSDGEAAISGLSGRFPDRLRIAHLEVIDPGGVWMTAEDLALDWSLRALWHRRAEIDRLAVARIEIMRQPAYPEDPEEDNSLPVLLAFRDLDVARLDLRTPVAGAPMTLHLKGSVDLSALDQGRAEVRLTRLDAAGTYQLAGLAGPDGAQLRFRVAEPPQGLLAGLAGLPELGAINAEASLDGPWAASRAAVAVEAGPLRAAASGTIDWPGGMAQLDFTLNAPAMQPRPGWSWESLALKAHSDGPFLRPEINAQLTVEQLNAAGASVRRLAAELGGHGQRVQLRAAATGMRVPGPNPELLAADPLRLTASADLEETARPVRFKLEHPLLAAVGTIVSEGTRSMTATLTLPALGPLLAGFGVELQGSTALELAVTELDDGAQVELGGKLAATGGAAPLRALIGPAATLHGSARLQGERVAISQFGFGGEALTWSAEGHADPRSIDARFKLALTELKALSNDLRGHLTLDGTLLGAPASMNLEAALSAEVSARGVPSGPLTAKLKASGLPNEPAGTLNAQGSLDGAPVAIAIAVTSMASDQVQARMDHLDWKSLHASGAVSAQRGTSIPVGRLEARIGHLEDLTRVAGRPLTGTLTASLDTSRGERATQARLRVEGHAIGMPGNVVAERLELSATAQDPLGHPTLAGQLAISGLRAGAVDHAALRINASGPFDAIATQVELALPEISGTALETNAHLILDPVARELELTSLLARWRNEVVRLPQPTRIAFGDRLAVSRLRLAWRQAELQLDGRVAPELDLSAELRNLSAEVMTLFFPNMALDGQLQVTARLQGTPARPQGTARVDLSGLQGRSPNARGVPPVNLGVNAVLDGDSARIDGRLAAGPHAHLTLAGDVPFPATGTLELHTEGSADLKLLDPLLMAEGRRVRGRVLLNAGLRGSRAEPTITGGLQLSQGDFEDYAVGLRLSDMAASVQSDGDKLRIDRLEAHAGQGRIDVRGSIGVLQAGLPIDLALTARNARPLSSDRMNVTLDSDLVLRGDAHQRLAAAGKIHVRRAEIRIPEHIPATIAVLDVRMPGAPPPPPAEPGPDVGIDLTIDANDEIFVRGRGLDAEMYGKIHLLGTANSPQPNGRFAMRRGQFTLMGKTLTFSRGEVGFDGGTLTNPTLDFVANATSNNITATLAVAGTARKPKIILTSVPELPQDEILAQLLFGRGSQALSPLELAQIAGALASLTGVTSGISNPLETVRKGLGLDRLAVGSTKAGAPTLEAGRYVAPGVYLGAKQGFSGGSAIPQAAVQIDVTEGLKLEGTVGADNNNATSTSTGASSAGVLYQFEY